MLFYETIDPPPSTDTQKNETLRYNNTGHVIITLIFYSLSSSPLLGPGGGSVEDKLSQLQELVQKGERRGLFEDDAIPSEIQRSV